MTSKLKVLTAGIRVKLGRGESLDNILESYVKLTEEEKDSLRNYFNDSIKEGL